MDKIIDIQVKELQDVVVNQSQKEMVEEMGLAEKDRVQACVWQVPSWGIPANTKPGSL